MTPQEAAAELALLGEEIGDDGLSPDEVVAACKAARHELAAERQASQGIRAVAFNALTAATQPGARLALSERERLAGAVADAVDPLARADEAARFWAAAQAFPEPFRSLIARVAARHSLPGET